MKFYFWVFVVLTLTNVLAVVLNFYILDKTVNSYWYVQDVRQDVELEAIPDYVEFKEITPEQEAWVELNAPLIDVNNLP